VAPLPAPSAPQPVPAARPPAQAGPSGVTTIEVETLNGGAWGWLRNLLRPTSADEVEAAHAHQRELAAVRVQAAIRGHNSRMIARSRRALRKAEAAAALAAAPPLLRKPSNLQKRKFKRFENDYVRPAGKVSFPRAEALPAALPPSPVEEAGAPPPPPPRRLPEAPPSLPEEIMEGADEPEPLATGDEPLPTGGEDAPPVSPPPTQPQSPPPQGTTVVKRPSFMKRVTSRLSFRRATSFRLRRATSFGRPSGQGGPAARAA